MTQYPPPPSGNQPPGAGPTKCGQAVAAMWCGIAGFVCLIPAILGIVFGFVAKKKIRESGGTLTGDGMATAGIVLGILWIVLGIILIATGGVDFEFSTN